MSIIVHCTTGPNAGRAISAADYDAASRARDEFEKAGNTVELRPVDNSRDWNNTADLVVLAEIRREREEAEGVYERDDDPEGD